MRTIDVNKVTAAVKRLCRDINYHLDPLILSALGRACRQERSPRGRAALCRLQENARLAARERIPICQDCGLAVVFLEVGQDLRLRGGDINEAVQQGVRQAYQQDYLRKSVVDSPLRRRNTGDNTPAVIHTFIVPGDKLKVTVAAKGGGSENMSRLAMLKPADGEAAIKELVCRTVMEAGPNPCPPVVIGLGIGGNFETCALLAKQALVRPLGRPSRERDLARLERELLRAVNASGVGPQGLGGTVTCLAVHIEARPCHIASLPVAVNLDCYVSRHGSAVL